MKCIVLFVISACLVEVWIVYFTCILEFFDNIFTSDLQCIPAMPQQSEESAASLTEFDAAIDLSGQHNRRTISPLSIMTAFGDLFAQFVFNQLLDSMVEFIKGLRPGA